MQRRRRRRRRQMAKVDNRVSLTKPPPLPTLDTFCLFSLSQIFPGRLIVRFCGEIKVRVRL